MDLEYDLLAIGCGPAGQKAAIQATKLGKRAVVVERRQVGGVCVITGTIPSKTLREAVLHLTGSLSAGCTARATGSRTRSPWRTSAPGTWT